MTTKRKRTARGVVLLGLSGVTLGLGGVHAARPTVDALVLGGDDAVRTAVLRHGGEVRVDLSVLDGMIARVPAASVSALDDEPGIVGVALDRTASLEGVVPGSSYDPATQAGSMATTAALTGAPGYWADGIDGAGVDVALVDSGVQPSTFFGARLVPGTDVSGEGNPLVDGFGHGTHLAGIIAGSLPATSSAPGFSGMAPGARIVSVKVADKAGTSGLLKVIQGLDWVFLNRATGGRNIKVVNLAIGVPALSSYVNDPLATAVEKLHNAGLSVVAAAGNIGPDLGLVAPAYDPFVVAVGALDTRGTVGGADDAVASFSAGAVTLNDRRPDILAPGRSIQSVLATGSVAAASAPASSKIANTYLVGSGTSQAAAVVSGALALMWDELPTSNPSSQKLRITNHSSQMGGADLRVVGWGKLNLGIVKRTTDQGTQSFPAATASTTNLNATADSAARAATVQGSSWQGSTWQGSTWQGSTWQGSTWQGSSWQATTWR